LKRADSDLEEVNSESQQQGAVNDYWRLKKYLKYLGGVILLIAVIEAGINYQKMMDRFQAYIVWA
jgi:hypothetical protein